VMLTYCAIGMLLLTPWTKLSVGIMLQTGTGVGVTGGGVTGGGVTGGGVTGGGVTGGGVIWIGSVDGGGTVTMGAVADVLPPPPPPHACSASVLAPTEQSLMKFRRETELFPARLGSAAVAADSLVGMQE